MVDFLHFAFRASFAVLVTALPSEIPTLPLTLPVKGFPTVWKLFLLHNSLSRVQVPIPKSFVSLFIFTFCPTKF